MRNKIAVVIAVLGVLLGLFAPPAPQAQAKDVTVTQTCNVKVTFKATVPDSVEQGKSFTVSNITVQPANTYGFTVTSSVLKMSATNTSSSSYSQDFYATDPSPTTGHNTYVSYYPNWSLDATGDAGSSVTIKLVSTQTVVQGYGNVNCPFTATLATIPITVPPPPSPSPSSTPSPSSSPSSSPTSSPSGGSGGGSSSGSSGSGSKNSGSSGSSTGTKTGTKQDSSGNTTKTDTGDGSASQSTDNSVTVVPLNVDVKDSTGKRVKGAIVTLDGSQKLTTDDAGRVTFSNVLTGSHAILVSYKGQKINQDIHLTTANVGGVITVSLPASAKVPLPAIITGGIGLVAAAGVAAVFVVRRRRDAAAAQQPESAMSIPGIISGSAVPTPQEATITHIPAVTAFEPQSTAPNPAPWTPPALVQPAPESAPSAPMPAISTPTPTPAPTPEEPAQAVAAEPQAPVAPVSPVVSAPTASGPVSIPVTQLPSSPLAPPAPPVQSPLQVESTPPPLQYPDTPSPQPQ